MAPPTPPPVRRLRRRRRPVEVARVGGVHARRRRDARGDRRPRHVPRRHPLRECWARRRWPLLRVRDERPHFCDWSSCNVGCDAGSARQGQFCRPSSAAAAAAATLYRSGVVTILSVVVSPPRHRLRSAAPRQPRARRLPRTPAGRRRRGDGRSPVAEASSPAPRSPFRGWCPSRPSRWPPHYSRGTEARGGEVCDELAYFEGRKSRVTGPTYLSIYLRLSEPLVPTGGRRARRQEDGQCSA